MNDAARLRHFLASQRFPAERWELVVGAESYGADELTRRDLWILPAGRYATVADVVRAVEQARARIAMS
jgi:hypothetical protein